jgi:hypothetical protein
MIAQWTMIAQERKQEKRLSKGLAGGGQAIMIAFKKIWTSSQNSPRANGKSTVFVGLLRGS